MKFEALDFDFIPKPQLTPFVQTIKKKNRVLYRTKSLPSEWDDLQLEWISWEICRMHRMTMTATGENDYLKTERFECIVEHNSSNKLSETGIKTSSRQGSLWKRVKNAKRNCVRFIGRKFSFY